MMTVSLSQDDSDVQALLERLGRAVADGRAMNRVVAEAGADATREHLRGLSRSRHRAVVAHNFYGRAADAVVGSAQQDGAEISIAHEGLRLRWLGGRVFPSGRTSLVTGKPIRKLAIPLSGSPAEGKAVGEFRDLTLVVTRRKKAFLAQRKSRGALTFLFVLKEMTKHDPDPSVMPTDDAYRTSALHALDVFVEEVSRG